MSEIKNDGLDQYGAEPFEQQQFGRAGVKGVQHCYTMSYRYLHVQSMDVKVIIVVYIMFILLLSLT